MIYSNSSYEALHELEHQRLGDYDDFCRYSTDEEEICENCGESIFTGDDRLECVNGIYCRECVMNMTSEDIVELLGFKFVNSNSEKL